MAITLHLPPELHEQVRAIAVAERLSIAETLIVAVEEYVQRHQRQAQVHATSERISAEDAELLKRLGDAPASRQAPPSPRAAGRLARRSCRLGEPSMSKPPA